MHLVEGSDCRVGKILRATVRQLCGRTGGDILSGKESLRSLSLDGSSESESWREKGEGSGGVGRAELAWSAVIGSKPVDGQGDGSFWDGNMDPKSKLPIMVKSMEADMAVSKSVVSSPPNKDGAPESEPKPSTEVFKLSND